MKRYAWVLSLVSLTIILSTVVFSMAVDPYCIVHPLLGKFTFLPNNRVPKLQFLAKSCANYDAYFVGDSRSATLSERDLSNTHGHRFYNLSTPSDDIASISRRLQFLLDRGCRISALIVDESVDVLLDDRESNAYGLLLSESPMISGENRLAFYSQYFLSIQSLTTYYGARHLQPVPHQVYYPDGHADYLWGMQDGSPFLLPRCGVPSLTRDQRNLLPARLAGYREFAQLAQRHHIRTIVWFAPVNRWESGILDDPDIVAFRRELQAIPGLSVVEADRDSPLLSDFRDWHDCGHFRREVFDQLLAPTISQLLVPQGN